MTVNTQLLLMDKINVHVNDVLTEHKHKHKKKAYAYAYVAAVLTSA